jgi:hypothetical protein
VTGVSANPNTEREAEEWVVDLRRSPPAIVGRLLWRDADYAVGWSGASGYPGYERHDYARANDVLVVSVDAVVAEMLKEAAEE